MAGSSATARSIDEKAVATVQRRLARFPEPPWLHAEIAGRMAERLQLFRAAPQRIVDWSSFLGAGAQRLATDFPQAVSTFVEPCQALAARSQMILRPPWWRLKRWTEPAADVRLPSEAMPADVQLVWANMMLHGASDPWAVMQRWQQMLAPGGFVMFSCLGPDTLQELTALYAQLRWPAPTIAFVDMHDLGDMLVHAGFADPVMDQEHLTVHWDSPAALCKDLRRLGGNVSPARYAGLRTPRWQAGLYRSLDQLRDSSGRYALTFEVVYGHAFKPESTARKPADTQVSLEEMRRLVRAPRKSVV